MLFRAELLSFKDLKLGVPPSIQNEFKAILISTFTFIVLNLEKNSKIVCTRLEEDLV